MYKLTILRTEAVRPLGALRGLFEEFFPFKEPRTISFVSDGPTRDALYFFEVR